MKGLLSSPLRNLFAGVVYMLVVIILATTGYVAAGWSFSDAVYMVVLTVYTVGYDEVRGIDTPELRTITMATIVFGCTGMIFLTGALVQFITINQLQQFLGVKRMKSQIDSLKDHVIICGYGRIGVMLAQELHASGVAFVILERSEPRIAQGRNLDYLCIQGDATDEDMLKDAGIMRARLLATVLPDDAANVFITLSARSLNKSLKIIARGEAPTTENKLRYAGADHVVLPTHIGAERIAEMILHAETSRFFRSTARMRDFEKVLNSLGLELELFNAAEDGPYAGLSVAAIEEKTKLGLIVRVDRPDGKMIDDPPSSMVIEPGDGIVVVTKSGRASALSKTKPA